MKKKRRLKFKNIIILGLFIGLGFYFYENYIEINYPSYEVIKEDTSKKKQKMKMDIFPPSQLILLIRKLILNINKMVMLLGAIILTGEEL